MKLQKHYRNERKPWEPGKLNRANIVYWPEHPLSTVNGQVNLNKLLLWQEHDYDIGALKLLRNRTALDSGGKRRFPFEPGKLFWPRKGLGLGHVYWPEHPLASKGSHGVSLKALTIWQKSDYNNETLDYLIGGGARGPCTSRNKFDPGNLSVLTKQGLKYETLCWPEHPLKNSTRRVAVHRLVYWQSTDYDNRVLELLRAGAVVHHLDGDTLNNNPSNLELRISTNHRPGVGERDWIKILELRGYKITAPKRMKNDRL